MEISDGRARNGGDRSVLEFGGQFREVDDAFIQRPLILAARGYASSANRWGPIECTGVHLGSKTVHFQTGFRKVMHPSNSSTTIELCTQSPMGMMIAGHEQVLNAILEQATSRRPN